MPSLVFAGSPRFEQGSVLGQLLFAKLGFHPDEAVVVDFTTDTLLIRSLATPAKNYLGAPGSKMTAGGTPEAGVNDGLTNGHYQLGSSLWPYWPDGAGTMWVEVVRHDNSVHQTFMNISEAGEENTAFRSGGAPSNLRLKINADLTEASSHVFAEEASLSMAARVDGDNVGYAVNGLLVGSFDDWEISPGPLDTLRFNQSGQTCEILRAIIVPNLISDTQLTTMSRPASIQTFYADADAGDDSNDGLSFGEAFETIEALLDHNELRQCDHIVLNGRFHEHSITGWPIVGTISAHDDETPPIIDGSNLIANGDWSADGTYSNVYKATVAHDTEVSQPGLFSPQLHYGSMIGRNRQLTYGTSVSSLTIGTGSKVFAVGTGRDFQVGDRVIARVPAATSTHKWMYGTVTGYSSGNLTVTVTMTVGSGTFTDWTVWVTTELIGIWGGANIAANRAALVPGTFTCHKNGSTTENPANDTSVQTLVYYVYLPDSSNPGSAVLELAYSEAVQVCTMAGGETFDHIIFQKTSTKDLVNKNAGDRRTTYTDCEFYDCTAHASVVSPSTHLRSTMVAAYVSRDIKAGGGVHFFRDTAQEGPAAACFATDCFMMGFQKGGYSHGTDSSDEQVEVTYDGCTEVDCIDAIHTGHTTNGTHIIDNVRINSGVFVLNDADDTTVNSP